MLSVTVLVFESRVLTGTFGAMRAEETGHDEELHK
jgi:hypothetical protein